MPLSLPLLASLPLSGSFQFSGRSGLRYVHIKTSLKQGCLIYLFALLVLMVSQIQKQFPPSKEGECEFERYCFELNFGRDLDGNVVITPEMLWDKLNEVKNIPSTHPLIDDSAVNSIEVNDAEVLSPSKK